MSNEVTATVADALKKLTSSEDAPAAVSAALKNMGVSDEVIATVNKALKQLGIASEASSMVGDALKTLGGTENVTAAVSGMQMSSGEAPAAIGDVFKKLAGGSGGDVRSAVSDDAVKQLGGEDKKANLFRALAVVLALGGGGIIAAPTKLVEAAYLATPTPLVAGLTQVVGATFFLASSVSWCLANAALGNRLSGNTYQRLSLGLAAWGAVSLAAVQIFPPVAATTTAQAVFSGLAGVVALSAGTTFQSASGRTLAAQPSALAQDFVASVQGMLSYETPMVAAYSVATKVAGLLVAACWAGVIPGIEGSPLSQPVGALGKTALRIAAAGALLATYALFTLADAAKRGRLGASTFKLLNLGVAATSIGVAAVVANLVREGVLVLDTSAPALVQALGYGALGVPAALGLLTLYNSFAAKK